MDCKMWIIYPFLNDYVPSYYAERDAGEMVSISMFSSQRFEVAQMEAKKNLEQRTSWLSHSHVLVYGS